MNINRATRREAIAAMDFSIMTATLSRRFFHTHDRKFGLAPADTQRGDVVCYIRGGKMPFILRKDYHAGFRHFQLVGDCYLLGMNEDSLESFKDDREGITDIDTEWPIYLV